MAAWDSLDEAAKDRFDHMMATYAAVMSRLDRSIGNLVNALKERGELDNTVILFMSDNGGNGESGPNGRSTGDPTKASSDWFCGRSWAYLENTPFRMSKRFNHEGGIASPLIVHWSVGLKRPESGARAAFIDTPAHAIDILPTCLDLGGATYPESRNGKPVTPVEGKSLKPLFTGSGPLAPRMLFWEHEGNAAVRQGDLKLVRHGMKGAWELYDLKADRTETNNLASSQAEKAKELQVLWRSWAKRTNVIPKPGAGKKDGGEE